MKELRFHGEEIVTGMGSLHYLSKLSIKRAFLVTGQGSVFKNGTIDRIKNILESIGCAYEIHSGIKKNPDTQAVIDGVAQMKSFVPEAIIAVGGGSAIDAAKVMAVMYE